MSGETRVNLAGRNGQGSTEPISPKQDLGFGPNEYNVHTGIDVTAEDPGAAMLAAVEEMSLRDPESYCFRVEHLRTGRKWEVELYPNGEIEVKDWE